MINSIRQETVVKEGGRVEILSPDLPTGVRVEVIVLVEPFESKTDRWLRLAADDRQLEQVCKEFAAKQWVELGDNDDLDNSINQNILDSTKERKRRLGTANGLFTISENFDELLEDFKDYQ